LPDIQSPLDVAALIWEKVGFFSAMVEEPEAVEALVHMTERLITDFLDLWFERYGKEFIAHYPDYYMPYGITLSEDEVGTISPDMFERFSLPSINTLSRRYGQVGVHCCANSEHQWQSFKKIENLVLLNFVQSPEVIARAYPVFADTCVQMHAAVDVVMPNTQGARVVLQAFAGSKEEAIERAKQLRELEQVVFTQPFP